ncbi:TetR/AcrR family transcriptional regulator [Nonomuraea sp. NPDC005983]|uniref:TetR/AcrR family transcriptional regulator n=1 Tax=Nonomuraea sp. NPDC005983 TaxID=3155595 RepID=UPI00339EEBC9
MKDQPPTGLTRRRRRLSDEETQQRMLETAVAMVNRTGLTVSLEHISFEEVIRDAGVSRSAVYRRWPYKDLFFSDLLREIARATTPAIAAGGSAIELVSSVIHDHLDWLETPELRHELCLEILRQGALRDFETIHGSTEWRTYIALHATFLSLDDGDLRTDVQHALARSEQAFVDRMAAAYRHLADLLGYRLRPELGATFETMAGLAQAGMRGLVTMAMSTPDVATRRIRATPFGSARTTDWSLPAIGAAATAFSFIEPDPAVEWTAERLERLRRSLGA